MRRPKVSVAMAVYNGETYLREQIESILNQLNEDDELVISYNISNDNSLKILLDYSTIDKRVVVIKCSENGVISNFENALQSCKNDLIFLSDQDDVWVEDKINIMVKYFDNPKIGCVVHKSSLVDSNLNSLNSSIVKNNNIKRIRAINIILKNEVQGCCMAFRKEYFKYIFPIPRNVPMHDSWIGLNISLKAKILLIPNELVLYRQHENNVTSRQHQTVLKMILDRCRLIFNIIARCLLW